MGRYNDRGLTDGTHLIIEVQIPENLYLQTETCLSAEGNFDMSLLHDCFTLACEGQNA